MPTPTMPTSTRPRPAGRRRWRRPAGVATIVVTGLVLVQLVLGPLPRVAPPACAHPDGPPLGPPPETTTAVRGTPKGPVGWASLRGLDDLPLLSVGTQPRMFSSHDDRGGNGDGFRGTHLCRVADGYVIAEHAGPGELTSLWFTRGDGDVSANGSLRIVLDGVTVVDAPLQDVVEGELGPPFVYPLVADADQSSGGAVIQVPMPYRRSMRVLTTSPPRFHRVQYRAFADAVGVPRFDPGDPATDVLARLRAGGPPHDDGDDAEPARQERRRLRLDAGAATDPVRLGGPGVITALRVRLPQVSAIPQAAHGEAPPGSRDVVVDVAPDNDGVQLVRRNATRAAVQEAPVLVAGSDRPRAFSRPRTTATGEHVQVLDVPVALTRGRSELDVAGLAGGPAVLEVRSRVGDTWERTDRRELAPSGPASATPDADGGILRGLRLEVRVDGRRTVDVPVGEFFGVGLGERPVDALTFAVDPVDGYHAWWPMPFARSAEVRLRNDAGRTLETGELEVAWRPDPQWAVELGPGGRAGHFHATYREGPVTNGEDWTMLEATGHGHVVGMTQTVLGGQPGRTYLEGDERVRLDGAASPQLHGTGTEDLYLAGWYFNRGPFSTPFSGHSAHLESQPGCPYECDTMYRVLAADVLPFHRDVRLGIEHGPVNDIAATYRTTTFSYRRPEPAMRRTDRLDVGDRRSEAAHGYTGLGEVRRLRSRYHGPAGDTMVADVLRASEDEVRFHLAVDPDNGGVLLRRRADQGRRGQAAQVIVDGVPVATWFQPDGNPVHRWLDDDLLLPAHVTRGTDRIEVALRPVPGSPPWTAARYEAFSLRPVAQK